ncbi:MAG: LysR substrate-binding domain-containing protein, partial [Polyangiaceae bacterium]
VTVADDLPAGMRRVPLFKGGFVCLFDPRHVRLPKRLSLERYLAEQHVIVSYNGDLRGVVEDILGLKRRVRLSVPSFQMVGVALSGSALLATVPEIVARELRRSRPELRTRALPFGLDGGTGMELIWQSALDDAGPVRFIREHIVHIAGRLGR